MTPCSSEMGLHEELIWLFNSVLSVHLACVCVRADGFHVQSITPLETLHNALTLRQVEHFIKNVTDMHCRAPPLCITPSTPPQSHQPAQLAMHSARLAVPSASSQLRGTSHISTLSFIVCSQRKHSKDCVVQCILNMTVRLL